MGDGGGPVACGHYHKDLEFEGLPFEDTQHGHIRNIEMSWTIRRAENFKGQQRKLTILHTTDVTPNLPGTRFVEALVRPGKVT